MKVAYEGKVVVIPRTCSKCGAEIEVECRADKTFTVGLPHFYRLDCPACGQLHHPNLPDEIVTVTLRSGGPQP